MIKRILRKILATTLSLCCMLGTSCSSTTLSKSYVVEQEDMTISLILKCQGIEFWEVVQKGATDACEELGIKLEYKAPPTEQDIDIQKQLLQESIDNNVDAIVLAPLDTDALNNELRNATEKGIPVVTIDSSVNYPDIKAFIGTQSKTAGAIACREGATLINGKGKAIILTHVEGAQTSIERRDGFKNELEANYPNIEIVAELCGNNDTEYSKQIILEELDKNNNDVQLIYATNEGVALGACEAVAQLGLQDKIVVTGFDSSTTEVKYLEEGILKGMMVQNPYNFGYLGVRNAYKSAKGETIQSVIDTGVTYVNKDNLYDEDIQLLLYPMGK